MGYDITSKVVFGRSVSLALSLVLMAATSGAARAETDAVPFAGAYADSALTGIWDHGAEQVIEGSPTNYFSTERSSSPTNTESWFLSAHFASDSAPVSINGVQLYPRYQAGVALAFPVRYEIMVTAANNGDWISVGTYCDQPTGIGPVSITFPTSYQTYGILVRPIEFGLDNYDAYYFQLEKIVGSKSTESATLFCH